MGFSRWKIGKLDKNGNALQYKKIKKSSSKAKERSNIEYLVLRCTRTYATKTRSEKTRALLDFWTGHKLTAKRFLPILKLKQGKRCLPEERVSMNVLFSSREYDFHTLIKVAEMAGLAGVITFHQAGDDYLVTFPDIENTEANVQDYRASLRDLENNIWSH